MPYSDTLPAGISCNPCNRASAPHSAVFLLFDIFLYNIDMTFYLIFEYTRYAKHALTTTHLPVFFLLFIYGHKKKPAKALSLPAFTESRQNQIFEYITYLNTLPITQPYPFLLNPAKFNQVRYQENDFKPKAAGIWQD